MFGSKTQSKVKMVKKDIECCQCWKKICAVWIKPDDEEKFKDGYHMCPSCFAELSVNAIKNKEK